MKRRIRSEISIFSISFLDLLFCGLAAVVLLWVIIDPPSKTLSTTPNRFQFVTIGQTGLWHLKSIEIGLVTWTQAGLQSSRSLENADEFARSVLSDKGMVASYSGPSRGPALPGGDETGGFAGSITFGANDETEDCEVRVTFMRCGLSNHSHHISVQSFSERGHSEAAFLFDRSDESKKASFASAGATGVSLGNVASGAESQCVLTFSVSKGRVRLISATPVKANAIVGYEL